MKDVERRALTKELSAHVGRIAADLRPQMLGSELARKLHADEQVGDPFEVWTDLLSRRAAVLFVLKSVYVRVLEDRGLVQPVRIVDRESQALFEQLAPSLGETAYLQWVYRDLAQPNGGLPELFAPQPAEIGQPSNESSRALLGVWRERDPETGLLKWRFDGESFDGALLGDLYQDLDPVVKARYALLQTPDFVRDFILDHTLTPALAEYGATRVRVLDPACGSGHFLLAAFRRLVAATSEAEPTWARGLVVRHALDRVVGIDLNDYACALARARLVMVAAELAGATTLEAAAAYHPRVYWADGLEQLEREPTQVEMFGGAEVRATLTRPEVRRALRPVLEAGFEVVVANPPYITEKDPKRKEYHREKVGKRRRYVSAASKYSLASPFTERCFQLATKGGFVGLITSNNFMKREFGKALIEEVLAQEDLTLVVDTSGAFIPGHGTPTVVFFGRHRKPTSDTVRAVMGKRGEPSSPGDPAQGLVWMSILGAVQVEAFENEFVSSALLARGVLRQHPWSLGGGGAADLKQRLDEAADRTLGDWATDIGFDAIMGEDDIFTAPMGFWRRSGVAPELLREFVEGAVVRDWSISPELTVLFPYDHHLAPIDVRDHARLLYHLERYRTKLVNRLQFGKTTIEAGLQWFEYRSFYKAKRSTPLSIAFAFVATHNHFVLDRGGKVFNRSAPVIKLPPSATEDDHLALLGLLNSSVACFWMKQVFHDKGAGTDKGKWQPDPAKIAYEFASTPLLEFPVPNLKHRQTVIEMAKSIDEIARVRASELPSALAGEWRTRSDLEVLLTGAKLLEEGELNQQIYLQEALDWICMADFGLLPDQSTVDLEPDSQSRCQLGSRPFEVLLARSGRRVGVDGHTLSTDLHGVSSGQHALWEARISTIQAEAAVTLVENEAYKRRWLNPPKHLAGRIETFEHRAQDALESWLTDRVEAELSAHAAPRTARQVAAALRDPRVLGAAELYTGRPDFDLEQVVAKLLEAESVPQHPAQVYSAKGLEKRAAWERTWANQRREDAGEPVTPEVPPSYVQGDFQKARYYAQRGKLDVPKERFVALTEVPRAPDEDPLFGWAGWTPAERARVILDLDEQLDDAGVPLSARQPLLASAWRLLPDLERQDPEVARRTRAELVALVGPGGPVES
ncbi:MAG: BREX-2 system adenine-specific DNA-methyltransferase PglX [Myxococcota bacterium]